MKMNNFKNSMLRTLLTINHTVDYMARGFMIFMRGIDITWGIGRVLLKYFWVGIERIRFRGKGADPDPQHW